MAQSWFVYLLECDDNSIYTGITTDVAARYAQHVSGKGARYTRAHAPRRIVKVVECTSRSLASQAEYWIKQLSAQAKRAWLAACTEDSATLSDTD